MKLFILAILIWAHIIADYNLQGILATMKQKTWWSKAIANDDKYKYDYIAALLCHAFSWSFIVHIPISIMMYYSNDKHFLALSISILVHFIIHAIIDNTKANLNKINLVQDQLLHLLQLLIIFISFVLF
jgi:hypothetical protein